MIRSPFNHMLIVGFGALLLAGGLSCAVLQAQPPGPKGFGPKGPPGPPLDGQFMSVQGTVTEFTTAPKGETDGAILGDGTWVHWPPHLENQFTGIAKGDKIKVTGYLETGPKGDTKLEVTTLTNLRTGKTIANPDRPAPLQAGIAGKFAPANGEFETVQGTVKEFTTAPKGEMDGLLLTDGTWVHWPPHLEDRFAGIAKGDKIKALGRWETGPKGDTKLEVSKLTNMRTGKVGINDDLPAPGPAQAGFGKAADMEQRIQALEEKMDLLLKQIKQLKKK